MLLPLILFPLLGFTAAFPFPADCGINFIEPTNVDGTRKGSPSNGTRIVGGYEAVPGSWPWQAYLVYKGSFACGGTLISDQWIQTAGHCVYEPSGTPDAKDWTVVLGEFDDTQEDGWEQTFQLEAVFLNPQYDDAEIDWDTALMKLDRKAEMTDWVSPACFPQEDAQFGEEQMCITSGWGSINPPGDVWGPTLKQEYAQLWTTEECSSSQVYPGWVNDRMICAGFHLTGSEDEERCATLGFGDSGGPLVCRDENAKWTVIGATSWGSLCEAESYTPGVWADLQSMRQWIVDTMDQNSDP